jgi:hypothetical protein
MIHTRLVGEIFCRVSAQKNAAAAERLKGGVGEKSTGRKNLLDEKNLFF